MSSDLLSRSRIIAEEASDLPSTSCNKRHRRGRSQGVGRAVVAPHRARSACRCARVRAVAASGGCCFVGRTACRCGGGLLDACDLGGLRRLFPFQLLRPSPLQFLHLLMVPRLVQLEEIDHHLSYEAHVVEYPVADATDGTEDSTSEPRLLLLRVRLGSHLGSGVL